MPREKILSREDQAGLLIRSADDRLVDARKCFGTPGPSSAENEIAPQEPSFEAETLAGRPDLHRPCGLRVAEHVLFCANSQALRSDCNVVGYFCAFRGFAAGFGLASAAAESAFRGLFQYGLLHLGQTDGSSPDLSRGTHACSHRSHW